MKMKKYNITVNGTTYEVLVEDGSEFFASDDGVLYSADMTSLILYPRGKDSDEFTCYPFVRCKDEFHVISSSRDIGDTDLEETCKMSQLGCVFCDFSKHRRVEAVHVCLY